MRISDWSSDVCSSDLATRLCPVGEAPCRRADRLANSILRRVDLRPYGADGRGGCLAALHVELVHFVGDVLHLVDHAADLRTDAVDCELERSEEHTFELLSLMRISYAVFCLKKKKQASHLRAPFLV